MSSLSFMITNSKGKKDALLTMAMVSFACAMFLFVFGGLTITLGSWLSFTVPALDAAQLATLLGFQATFVTGYVKRRSDDNKLENKKEDKS